MIIGDGHQSPYLNRNITEGKDYKCTKKHVKIPQFSSQKCTSLIASTTMSRSEEVNCNEVGPETLKKMKVFMTFLIVASDLN